MFANIVVESADVITASERKSNLRTQQQRTSRKNHLNYIAHVSKHTLNIAPQDI